MRPLILVLVAGVQGGCMTSPPVSASSRPHVAAGIGTSLELMNGTRATGELLVLDSVAVTLLTAEGIVVVRHEAVTAAEFAGHRRMLRNAAGYATPRETWERIRLESRYPYGIPIPAVTAIMEDRRQARIDTIGAPGRVP